MPIYEFYCPDNHTLYSFFARSPSQAQAVPRCPDNPAFRMEKRVSAFAFVRKRPGAGEEGEDGDDPFADLDESQMERLLAGMEQEFGDLDNEHPDPRRLGHAMRRLFEALGRRPPENIQDILARLDAGEDPDALEAEMDSAFGDEGDPGASLFGEPGQSRGSLREIIDRLRGPRRDPHLYELADHLP